MPNDKFDWSANTWIELRKGNLSPNNYFNAGGYTGLMPVMWELFYDFHCLMNNEILYLQAPKYVANFDKLTEDELSEIDQLAFLLLDPEKNFNELINIRNAEKKFRLLLGPLITEKDHMN
jgi:hypothetical protein